MKLKRIRSYMTEFEAEQGKNLLEDHGIDAFVEGASSQTMLSYIGVAVGGVKLLVQEQDAERSTAILDAGLSKSSGPWTCPNCYCDVDAGFDICWRCGAYRENLEQADEREPVNTPAAHHLSAFVTGDGERSPARVPSSNPFQSPESPGMLTEEAETKSREELIERAWRAAVIGLAILPGIAHLYSLVLLTVACTKPSPLGVTPRMFATLVIDLVSLSVIAAWLSQSWS